jgi:lipopolysaccharide biosynthesis glycosyltransferase
MKILLTFDDAYAPHAAVVMESAVRNCPEKLDFVVIHYDISEATQTLLSHHFEGRIKSLEFFKVEVEKLLSIVGKTKDWRWGLPTWLRLFASMVLPESDHHIIYLDCDTIVCGNILEMPDGADLSKPICAVTSYNPAYKWGNLKRHKLAMLENIYVTETFSYRSSKNLGMSDDAAYFCAGTMIINLDYWRKYKISEQAIEFTQKHPEKIIVVDQDVLNHVINGNYGELHPRWDCQPYILQTNLNGYPQEWLLEAYKNPAIIHAPGWRYTCTDRNTRKQYRRYRKLTPYPQMKYTDKTISAIVKRLFPLYRNFIQFVIRILLLNKYELCRHRNTLAEFFLDPVQKHTD